MAKIKVLALDVQDGKGLYEITIDNDNLDAIYDILKCDTFDIATRKIGDRYYDIFCDDEGLFNENPIISAIEEGLNPMLVGNLMIANHDGAGETTALTAEDIQIIKMHTVKIADHASRRIYTALYPVGY